MRLSNGILGLSLFCSILAIVLSIANFLRSQSIAADQQIVYQQILDEAYDEMRPVYKDLGISDKKPKTFRELLRPFMAVRSGNIANEKNDERPNQK